MMTQNIKTAQTKTSKASFTGFSPEVLAKIKSLTNASHTAEVVMLYLAMRERLRDFTDLHRTRNQLISDGEKIVQEDFFALFRGLQALDIGEISTEKKGKNKDRTEETRFYWHVSFKKVAEAALEGRHAKTQTLISAPTQPKKVPVKSNRVKKNSAKLKMEARASAVKSVPLPAKKERFIYIPLRKDFHLELSVPADLSSAEAEMISKAVKRHAA